jgi:hypothetical protein
MMLPTEVMEVARRRPDIARISASFDVDVRAWLVGFLRAAAYRGDIIPADVDFGGVVSMLIVIADGVWWRRALDRAFDANSAFDPGALLAIVMDSTRHVLRGRANHNGHGASERRANNR